jgi:hypothetical protein
MLRKDRGVRLCLNWENCWETHPTQYISLTRRIKVPEFDVGLANRWPPTPQRCEPRRVRWVIKTTSICSNSAAFEKQRDEHNLLRNFFVADRYTASRLQPIEDCLAPPHSSGYMPRPLSLMVSLL